MMRDAKSIAQRVFADKGFLSPAEVALPPEIALPPVPFLGLREYWGSMMTVGLLDADGLAPAAIEAHSDAFYQFTHSLLPFAGSLQVGLAKVKLGSFGLLIFVVRTGCTDEIVSAVRRGKRGSAFRKDYAVSWAMDLPAQQVHTHSGFPLTMFPGAKYLRSLLA